MIRIRLAAVLVALALAPATAAAQTSVTIYNDGRVLARRVLPVALPAGTSVHRLTLGALDAGSLFALDSGVVMTGFRYDAALDFGSALRRAVGQELQFETRGANGARERVTATVVGFEPERYRLADGRITFERPGTPLFPAELAPPDAVVTVGVRTDRARPALGLGFFTGGASWRANYTIVLGRPAASVAGQATIASAGLKLDSAEVQLLAGNVGRAAPRPMAMAARAKEGFQLDEAVATGAAGEESAGEAHLYSLPGRHSVAPGTEYSALLFEPAAAPFERAFTVRGQVPYYGGLGPQGEEQLEPVAVTYTIKRTAKTPFGDLPVPGGAARLYQRDQAGRLQLIGESSLGHTAAGQDLRLDAGTAFDLTSKRVQTAFETRREGSRTIALAAYQVTLANAKDSTVAIDVLEQRAGEWTLLESSLPAEKLSSTVTRFRVRVPAKGQAVLTYRVRVVW